MTPESLVRHELAGLDVEVVDSPDPGLVGIAGRVQDETMRTLLVATGEGVKQVPKAAATFRFTVDCEAPRASNGERAEPRSAARSSGRSPREDGDEPRARVLVDGERLVARPARRTEANGGSQWQ